MAEPLIKERLRRLLSKPSLIEKNRFIILQNLSALVSSEEGSPVVQELVLRALDQREAFGLACDVVYALVRQLGLFPYLEPERISTSDRVAYEFHRPLRMGPYTVFHRVQAEVYRLLMSGESVVLSAPTSCGKSLIIDAMIASGSFDNIVVVVPTIALIDETRQRLARFKRRYKIITHGSQQKSHKNVFIVTQERVLEGVCGDAIDFFVIDEFYKLDIKSDKVRGNILNQAFYKLHKAARQFYLLGPNVEGLPEGFCDKYKCHFIKTNYATVVLQRHPVKARGDKLRAVAELCSTLSEHTLIYCQSPASVRNVAEALLATGTYSVKKELVPASKWMAQEYHPRWIYGRALKRGIGIHHARMPRALAQYTVRKFNEGAIDFLICTSTLIEGVNTRAKNVIIFDHKIANRNFDFFTFNNIAGRAGRMFVHFIGNVYAFREPPQPELPTVDIPLFTQGTEVPANLLLQMDKSDLSAQSLQRIQPLITQSALSVEILRQHSGVPPDKLIRLAGDMADRALLYSHRLSWNSMPNKDQLSFLCGIIWDYFVGHPQDGIFSAKHLAWWVNTLQFHQTTSDLIARELENEAEVDEAIDRVFQFLRNWATFNFPNYVRIVDSIQREVLTRCGFPVGDYALFAAKIENLFLEPPLVVLDEYGIPIELVRKICQALAEDRGPRRDPRYLDSDRSRPTRPYRLRKGAYHLCTQYTLKVTHPYAALSASTMLSREAWKAGSSPPSSPIPKAKARL